MKTSYFKVDRSIQKHWLWSQKPFSWGQAWIDLLLLASYQDSKAPIRGRLIDKQRGEVYVSLSFLEERWGWSRNKVRNYLTTLKNDKMIHTEGTPNGTTITIENYEIYQSSYHTKGITKSTTESITKGTTEGTAEGTQIINNNNININNNNHQEDIYSAVNNDDFHFKTKADKAGMTLKEFIKAKTKGEIE